MRGSAVGLVMVLGLSVMGTVACGSSAPSTTSGPSSDVSPASLPPCGPRQATLTDGSCVPVGPADPAPASRSAFARSVDGWGISATVGDRCAAGEMAVLGSTKCMPVDDCSRAFPPANAQVIVSTTSTDARAVPTMEAALTKVSPGGIIAVDSGTYNSSSIQSNVTIIGRCAKSTILGNGKNNALFVNGGAKVAISNVTLTSSSSPIAVQGGTVDADHVIVTSAHVAIGMFGKASKTTLKHSLIVGLGAADESMGALPAQGSVVVVEDSEIRDVSSGFLVSDPGSRAELTRVVLTVSNPLATSAALNASAGGYVQVDDSIIRSTETRLAAVYDDTGTDPSPTAKASAGTMVIRTSVLEQLGVEVKDIPAIAIRSTAADLQLIDVTLRHQAPIGVLVSDGKVHLNRVAILGEQKTAAMRCAIMTNGEGAIDAEALAVPWAQGIGLAVGDHGDMDLRKSFVANVVERGAAQEAVLVSAASASIADTELADNGRNGIVAIGDSRLAVQRAYVHGTHADDGMNEFGAVILHSTATFDGCIFEKNGEGIAAAGSSVLVSNTSLRSHRVALHAGDGMSVLDDKTQLVDNAIAVTACTFTENVARTSSAVLPELNASPIAVGKAAAKN